MVSDRREPKERHMHCGGLATKGKQCPHVVFLEGIGEWEHLWEQVCDRSSKGCCYILSLKNVKEAEKLTKNVEIPPGCACTVEIRVAESVKFQSELSFSVGEGASFGFLLRGVVGETSSVSLTMRSVQENKESVFSCRTRIVCNDGGVVRIEPTGHVGPESSGSTCVYDVKVLQVGTGGKVTVQPHLEVLGKNVKATHGFSVGRVPQDVRTYMESRGIDEKGVEELYMKGFLG